MKIQVKELGAIKEGTIDLSKKLNVFCGPNGTGKTYMAYVIYGLMRTGTHAGRGKDLVNNLIENKYVKYVINFNALDDYRETLIDSFKQEFDALFGIGQDLAKQYFETTEIVWGESREALKEEIIGSEFQRELIFGKVKIDIKKTKNTDFLELKISEDIIANKDIEQINFFLYSSVLSLLATYPISSTFILPVERNSIFTFSKELSIRKQEAVDHFHAMTSKEKGNKMDILLKNTTRYPLPIKEGLMIADDLSEIKKNTSKYFDFATEIEQELLHGSVQITSEGDIQFKSDKAPKKLLPIHMTASIIKSLSSLVIYLKHLAKENDLIIIDEPEINLHPDNQIILTKLFARLIHKGFRILVSTHSDYIVREFNNLIMLSSDKPEIEAWRQEFAYKKEEFIKKEDIAVHYFNYPQKQRGNKQVTVEPVEIGISGFEIPTIDATIDRQNRISEELYYALKYGSK